MTRRRAREREHLEQSAYIELVRHHERTSPLLGLIFAIPNGGGRSRAQGGKLKAEGVRPGVPDVCFPLPSECGRHPALWLEFKAPPPHNAPLSDAQRAYINALRMAGHRVEVVDDALEAWRITRTWLGARRTYGGSTHADSLVRDDPRRADRASG